MPTRQPFYSPADRRAARRGEAVPTRGSRIPGSRVLGDTLPYRPGGPTDQRRGLRLRFPPLGFAEGAPRLGRNQADRAEEYALPPDEPLRGTDWAEEGVLQGEHSSAVNNSKGRPTLPAPKNAFEATVHRALDFSEQEDAPLGGLQSLAPWSVCIASGVKVVI